MSASPLEHPVRRRQHTRGRTRQRIGATVSAVLLTAGLALVGQVMAPDHASAAPVASAASARPSTLVVGPNGNDHAAGTATHPLATVAGAVRRLPKGGTVLLRGGVYHQRFALGSAAHDLTIRNYRHEHPILDGTGLTAPSGMTGMITIDGSRKITVQGLDIRGYDTVSLSAFPIGVYVHGGSTGVTLRGNHVHSMGNYNGTLGSFDLNAHGIAVYGDSAAHAIRNLVIEGNQVDHLALGASESVVVNGNVDGWRISNNNIHDNNNIGIDAIGFEPTIKGADRYTIRNRARHGVITGNTVRNIISQGNPSYYQDGTWCNCADGIYVDGGTRIRIDHNTVSTSDIGIEVAAENARGNASHVLVDHNLVTGSRYVGLATGGYCNGTEACGDVKTGRSYDNTFRDNVFHNNNTLDDGSPEVLVQYYAYRDTFAHNVVWATDDAHAVIGTVPGANHDGLSKPLTADHNLYWTNGGHRSQATFGSLGHTYTGFDAYRKATGQDEHSRFAKPKPSQLR